MSRAAGSVCCSLPERRGAVELKLVRSGLKTTTTKKKQTLKEQQRAMASRSDQFQLTNLNRIAFC